VSGTETAEPPKICPNLPDLTRVIQHEQSSGDPEPVIYALIQANGACDASQLQFRSMPGVTKNGWLCLAVRAEDGAHNVGVSAPMRLCLWDTALGGQPDCANPDLSVQPPSCTRGCTPPPHFMQGVAQPYIRAP
jgi:hypothetical protein